MDRVKQMIAAGISASTAIKELLGQNVSAWADKHDLARSTTSEVLNGDRAPRVDICNALAQDLGGMPFDWALLLWESAKPSEERFAQLAANQ